MSLRNSKQLETNLYELEIVIDGATFKAACDKVFKKAVKNITIPGFRKGKAPRSIIEKMYGKGVFYEDAINECLPDAFEAALKDFDKETVGRPEFDISDINDETGEAVLTAKVYTKPEMKIDGYKGIEATRTVKPVTDDDINAEIERVRARNSRMIDITDRAAALEDTVNIDYSGSVDGVKFDGGTAEGQALTLGSGQFIPGFEEQIVGHNIGDEFDVNVTFPAEYHAEELAGKAAVFAVKLNGIKFNEKPEVNDEFVTEVSEFNTVDEYKADIKAKMEEHNGKDADTMVDEQLMKALVEKLEGEIPPVMIDAEVENMVRDFDTRLRMQGMDLKTYFKYTGLNLDAMREQSRPQAEIQVKTRLALETVAANENITASDEEIEAEFTRLSEAYGMEVEKIKAQILSEDLAADIKVKKAVELIRDNAVITEGKPEKKTAAKKTSTTKKSTTAKKTTKKADAEAAAEAPAEEKPKKAPAKKSTTTKKTAAKKTEEKPADAE
ncbi:MAG: trigger factor [Clostridia bacterium]|nr:trigger factor [Clostridia bacterium]